MCAFYAGQPPDAAVEDGLKQALTDPTTSFYTLLNLFGSPGFAIIFRFQNDMVDGPKKGYALIDEILRLAEKNPAATANIQTMTKSLVWWLGLAEAFKTKFLSGVELLPDNTPETGIGLLIKAVYKNSGWNGIIDQALHAMYPPQFTKEHVLEALKQAGIPGLATTRNSVYSVLKNGGLQDKYTLDTLLTNINEPGVLSLLYRFIGGFTHLNLYRLNGNNLVDEALSLNDPNAVEKLIAIGFDLKTPSNLYLQQATGLSLFMATACRDVSYEPFNALIARIPKTAEYVVNLKDWLKLLLDRIRLHVIIKTNLGYLGDIYATTRYMLSSFAVTPELNAIPSKVIPVLESFLSSVDGVVSGWQEPQMNSIPMLNIRFAGADASGPSLSLLTLLSYYILQPPSNQLFEVNQNMGETPDQYGVGGQEISAVVNNAVTYSYVGSTDLRGVYKTPWSYVDEDGHSHPTPGSNIQTNFDTGIVTASIITGIFYTGIVYRHNFWGIGTILDWAPFIQSADISPVASEGISLKDIII
jgi:hypothetical protein